MPVIMPVHRFGATSDDDGCLSNDDDKASAAASSHLTCACVFIVPTIHKFLPLCSFPFLFH